MIVYRKLNAKSPEFHEAYEIILQGIDPEFVETEEYLRERFRIQEQGAGTAVERRMMPEGFRIHMIVAIDDQRSQVVGAVYGNFIPKIGMENRGFALVTYVAVRSEYRRRNIGRELLTELTRNIHEDARSTTGRSAFCLLFEIEDEGKREIEHLAQKLGAYPLDIDYYQPSVREGCEEQAMNLWLLPLDQPVRSVEEAKQITFPAGDIHEMVKSLFIYEYPGPRKQGFDFGSVPYQALVRSLNNRSVVGFRLHRS
jgi:GNAT superfamily N-acetyltransferase